jgi:hypothetical protein
MSIFGNIKLLDTLHPLSKIITKEDLIKNQDSWNYDFKICGF